MRTVRPKSAALVVVIWACCGEMGIASARAAAVGTPLLAQAGAGLVAPGGVEQAGKPVNPVANVPGAKMAENFANAGKGGAAPDQPGAATAPTQPASAAGSGSLLKYAPSYALMVLAVSLGLIAVCRPTGFNLAALTVAKKPPTKK